MIKKEITEKLQEAADKIGAGKTDVEIELPGSPVYGDYSSSVAMKLTKILKRNPMIIAQELKDNIDTGENIEKIDIVKPGFINFWVNKKYFLKKTLSISEGKFNFPSFHLGKNKKIMVEFAHPNTHKLFHIGHLRNISTGEAMVRIFEAVGNEVIRTNYQGDVGLHIAKCLYGIKQSGIDYNKLQTLQEKIEFIGKMYTAGTAAYDDDKAAKDEILKINKMIYDQSPEIQPLWQETRQWSLDYYNEIYKRVSSHFDRLYFESEVTKRGLEISKEIYEKGILEKSQGAIVFNGKQYGLDTRVFINSLGFPTYEGKEMGLAEKEFSEFGELDKCVHVVTPEQTSFFKITFKVEELIDEAKYKNRQYHLAYEWVKLKDGKMSSRVGNIIEGNWLIDQIKKRILEKFKCSPETAEILSVASTKYSFLKNSTQTIVYFDIDESIAVEGNSAPYLIYSYVRCQSVLKKSGLKEFGTSIKPEDVGLDELNLMRKLHQFSSVVLKAAENYSPNLIANYLYELSSDFNVFYQKNPILKADFPTRELRLVLTKATSSVIKKGLSLMGINTVEKM